MTNQEINVAIAEECGWHHIDTFRVNGPEGFKPDVEGDLWNYVPNYCSDLNAMHNAEEKMDGKWFLYEVTLQHLLRCNPICHATARQRAEAFLRTVGKWKE